MIRLSDPRFFSVQLSTQPTVFQEDRAHVAKVAICTFKAHCVMKISAESV